MRTVLTIVALLGYLLYLNWQLTLIVLALFPLLLWQAEWVPGIGLNLGLLAWDGAGQLLYANPAFGRLVGHAPERRLVAALHRLVYVVAVAAIASW